MAGKITALVFQKKNKDRVNVFIDEVYAFSTTVNEALTLKKGQYLSDQDIADLKAKADTQKAYYAAIKYLGYRPRTEQEIEAYLTKKDYTPETIAQVIERLAHENYLDDAEFSRAWVQHRNTLNPKSKRALRYELRQKGVSETDINQAITEVNETEAAWKAARKRLSRWKNLDDITFRKKLTGYLARRGFNYETIKTVWTKIQTEAGSE